MFDKWTELIQQKPRVALNYGIAACLVTVVSGIVALFFLLRSDGSETVTQLRIQLSQSQGETKSERRRGDSLFFDCTRMRVAEKDDRFTDSKTETAELKKQLAKVSSTLSKQSAKIVEANTIANSLIK